MKRVILAVVAGLMIAGCDSAKKDPAQEPSMAAKAVKEAPAAVVKKSAVTTDFYAQGLKHLGEGDVNEAVQSFVRAIQESPADPESYLVLGQIYMRTENYGEAVQAFTAASRVAPGRGDIYYLLALAHGFNGERELAKQSAERSVEIFSQQQDEENFTRSLSLLQSFYRADEEEAAANGQ